MPMSDLGAGTQSRTRRAVRWLGLALLLAAAYYAAQAARDRRGIVREVFDTSAEPSANDPVDVTHIVRSHVPIGTAERDAVETLERGGFSVEVFEPARYEWLGYNCATCDRGAFGRFSRSYLRGGDRILVGVGFRRGRVAHLDAHRVVRIIEVP
jgi:hypothetical protein